MNTIKEWITEVNRLLAQRTENDMITYEEELRRIMESIDGCPPVEFFQGTKQEFVNRDKIVVIAKRKLHRINANNTKMGYIELVAKTELIGRTWDEIKEMEKKEYKFNLKKKKEKEDENKKTFLKEMKRHNLTNKDFAYLTKLKDNLIISERLTVEHGNDLK
jgi:hypothetical protein